VARAVAVVLAASGLAAVWLAGGRAQGDGNRDQSGAGTQAPDGRAAAILGFHRDAVTRQRDIEAILLKLADPARIEKHHRALTAGPHVAGTPGNVEVQRYIEARFREAGLETTTRSYSVYMGFVNEARLEMVAPETVRLATPEEAVAVITRAAARSFDPALMEPFQFVIGAVEPLERAA